MDNIKNELIARADKTDEAVQRLFERANDAFSDCKNIVDNAVNDIKTCTADFLDSAETRIVELICTEAGRTNAETAKKLDEQNERITKLAMQNDALKKLLTVVLAVGGACAIMLAVTIVLLLV